MLKRLVDAGDYASRLTAFAGGILILALTALTTYATLSRYLFGQAINLTEELGGLLLVGIAFLAFAHSFSINSHIRVTMFVSILPRRIREVLDVLTSIVALVYFVFLLIYTVEFTLLTSRMGAYSVTAKIYLIPWMALMPIGIGLCIVVVSLHTAYKLRNIVSGIPVGEVAVRSEGPTSGETRF